MNWLSQPHADYVLAAYALAVLALLGLGVASVVEYRRRARELRALSEGDSEGDKAKVK
jgi:heme exporter protein CcmD